MGRIIYAATPFRMELSTEQICNFIESQNCFPLHPFLALPYGRYNYDRHSRDLIFKVCFGLVDISDEVWIFGIGSGSFKEYKRAKDSGKPVKSLVKAFDPDWQEWSQKDKYKINYSSVLDEVLRTSVDKVDLVKFIDGRITGKENYS